MTPMTPKEFIDTYLQDCQYGEFITEEVADAAHDNNLVIVFGYSDDLCELRGGIDDEVGCYNGGDVYIDTNNFIIYEDNYGFSKDKVAGHIKALWDRDGYSWVYVTDIPHDTFEVYEDGEKYCRGIVFSLDDIQPKPTNYEKIKNMSIEEMADFLNNIVKHCCIGDCDNCFLFCSDIKMWLGKEVKEL